MAKKTRIEITMPVYNEEVELEEHIVKLYQFCKKHLTSYEWHITIADNASTDTTYDKAQGLSEKYSEIDAVRLTKKGRGRAVKRVWLASDADILSYMDIDLSTDLSHMSDMFDMIGSGYDIVIGTRLRSKSKVINRTIKREVVSRAYNILIKLFFQTSFSDAQCGFKAMSADAARTLLPHVADNEWFMDSELLIIAEKSGYRVGEIPVIWRDNPGSTVRVLPTAIGDLHGLLRLFMVRPWRVVPRPS